MRLTGVIWKIRFREKIACKHGVPVREVEEAVFGHPVILRVAKGHVHGEDVYLAFGRSQAGRYLAVFFVHKRGLALPISARDMTLSERRYYEKQG